MELLEKIIGTVILRWYVSLFLMGYIFIAVAHLGWRRMSFFSIIGFMIGFMADYSSTHNGFPFGLYHYTQLTDNKELFVGNVPIITALSFIFLSYIGYNIAIFIYSSLAVNKSDIQCVPTKEIEHSKRVCITGALIMSLIDVVIDPISLHGRKWFLGDFYWYHEKGGHFGVPITNYLGWFLVGFMTILIFQLTDRYVLKRYNGPFKGQRYIPFFGIAGIIFYFSILIFMLVVAFYIKEVQIAIHSIITFIPFILILAILFLKKSNRATANDFQLHFRDYPYSPLRNSSIILQYK